MSDVSSEEKQICIKRFYVLQEERVQTYNLFDEGHKAYLAGAPNYNFQLYRQLVHEITETFQKISEEIISIQKKFESEKEIMKLIGNVQEVEKKKLQLTVKLQIAQQNVLDHPDDANSHENDVKSLNEEIRESIEDINETLEELKYESENYLKT